MNHTINLRGPLALALLASLAVAQRPSRQVTFPTSQHGLAPAATLGIDGSLTVSDDYNPTGDFTTEHPFLTIPTGILRSGDIASWEADLQGTRIRHYLISGGNGAIGIIQHWIWPEGAPIPALSSSYSAAGDISSVCYRPASNTVFLLDCVTGSIESNTWNGSAPLPTSGWQTRITQGLLTLSLTDATAEPACGGTRLQLRRMVGRSVD